LSKHNNGNKAIQVVNNCSIFDIPFPFVRQQRGGRREKETHIEQQKREGERWRQEREIDDIEGSHAGQIEDIGDPAISV